MAYNPKTGEEDERVCMNCGVWVYWDNADVEFHCQCGVGWMWKSKFDKLKNNSDTPARKPARPMLPA